MCYGRDLARGKLVELNTAVGIIAAQSIGEPGTQLTLRTFHTGGIIGLDITTGLPRVEELFEARTPKAQALISEIGGLAEITQDDEGRHVKITNADVLTDEYKIPEKWQISVGDGQVIEANTIIASQVPPPKKKSDKTETTEVTLPSIAAQNGGEVKIKNNKILIKYEEKYEREYSVPITAQMRIKNGDKVEAGMQLTEGSLNPQDLMRILGRNAVQQYLVEEVQKVYRSQGVNINDKHIETISRQMLTQVRITSSGDTKLVPGEIVDRFHYEDSNAKVLSEGGEPATALPILLGITRASLNTDSWLAAASFQETTRVLTEAAVYGKIDKLIGLKENVIIGKLIPAHTVPVEKLADAAQETAGVAAPISTELLPAGIEAALDDELPEEDSPYGD
jgi:DNA-directed RNA polymerase subunit beta'